MFNSHDSTVDIEKKSIIIAICSFEFFLFLVIQRPYSTPIGGWIPDNTGKFKFHRIGV